MIYKEFQSDKQLADFVKCYWWFENSAERHDFTILPDGCFDLLIHFENNIQIEISLTGLWTKQVEVPIEPNTQIFGIRFKLLAVDYIFHQNIAAFCDSEQKLQNDFWQIDENNFSDLEKTIDIFNKIMLSVLGKQKGIDPKKQGLFNLLYETNGELTIEKYSQQVFWSSRQMNRYFTERFGLSLKSYCNILKCFASFKHLKNGKLYPEKNYFDQSHFIKAVKKHTGNSPSELFENKNDRFLQLTTLDKK